MTWYFCVRGHWGSRYCESEQFFLQYFGILGDIKYYLPSLPLFSEPIPRSDSFGDKLNSKITKLKLGSLQSKFSGFVLPFTHKQKKIRNKTSFLWSFLRWFWIWNLKLKRRIRTLFSPERLDIYKFQIAIFMLFVLFIFLKILGNLPILFFL